MAAHRQPRRQPARVRHVRPAHRRRPGASSGRSRRCSCCCRCSLARWAFEQTRAQQQAHAATIAALCQAVETKDYYTRGHSERVSRGSVMIAQAIGMRPERVGAIRYAGHAARRRQARRADQGAAEGRRRSPRRSSPRSSCTRCAAWRSSGRSASSTRRSPASCTTTSGWTARGYPMGLAGDGDPGVRPGHLGGRRLRLDDLHPLLPRRASARGGHRRAAPLRGHATSTPTWSRRSSPRWRPRGWEPARTGRPAGGRGGRDHPAGPRRPERARCASRAKGARDDTRMTGK